MAVLSARATSSSPSGSPPSTQPVSTSSRPPYTIQLANRESTSLRNEPSCLALLDYALNDRKRLAHLRHLALELLAARDLADHDRDEIRVVAPGPEQDLRDPLELLGRRLVRPLHAAEAFDELTPVLAEDRVQHLFLGREVVVEEPVRDARLRCDVCHSRAVVAVAREHADSRSEDELALVLSD